MLLCLSVFLSTNTDLPLGWGKEAVSISGVCRVGVVPIANISQQFKWQVVQRREILPPVSSNKARANSMFETQEGCGICVTDGQGDWWVQ